MKAINLEQVVQFFDPKQILSGQSLRMWFVQRAGSPRKRLAIILTKSHGAQKVLFVGHRGSGKSTELNKLVEEIGDDFYPIGFDVFDVTGRSTLRYEDLMLALSTRITRQCIEDKLIAQPLTDPLREGWQGLADWWRQVVAGLEFGREREVSTYASLNTLLGEIEIGASQSAFTRDQLNAQLDRQMPELIRRLNWVIDQAQRYLNPKRLVLIVEGLDKVDLEAARHIFRDHAPTITALNASMIFTVPLALRYSEDYQTVLRHFSDDCFLPNLAARHADVSDDAEGIRALREIILKRMESQLMDEEALTQIVLASGGIPVDLIKLVRKSAVYALERMERSEANQRIDVRDALNAIKDLRRELAASLSTAEWSILNQRHRDRKLSSEKAMQQLLQKVALIEYSNDVQWCDVHPALWGLLERYSGD